MINWKYKLVLILFLSFSAYSLFGYAEETNIPTAAPMTTDLAGGSANVAYPSVLRVLCPSKQMSGTGFLHKSGNVITAFHVVADCEAKDIILVNTYVKAVKVSKIIVDEVVDLALLIPAQEIKAPTLAIIEDDRFTIGSQVSTWGYPSGYSGLAPLLSSGYLSGTDNVLGPTGKKVTRLVVNAAFNSGNSGGPLVEIQNNKVIGVVASKLAPLPDHIVSALKALKDTKYGLQFTKNKPDGSTEKFSEAQVTEEILQYLRSQTQLVIGHAVLPRDLRNFLKSNGITP